MGQMRSTSRIEQNKNTSFITSWKILFLEQGLNPKRSTQTQVRVICNKVNIMEWINGLELNDLNNQNVNNSRYPLVRKSINRFE